MIHLMMIMMLIVMVMMVVMSTVMVAVMMTCQERLPQLDVRPLFLNDSLQNYHQTNQIASQHYQIIVTTFGVINLFLFSAKVKTQHRHTLIVIN